MKILTLETRASLNTRGKQGALYKSNRSKGKNRYLRRRYSKVASSVKQYNDLDMNRLFKLNIFSVNLLVNGLTDTYNVRISFGGFLLILRDQILRNGKLDLRGIIQALNIGFNKDNVYIGCTCPDFKYRFAYFCTRRQIISILSETRPSNITNPNDKLGPACKHVLLILSNASWLIKCASVINNYIAYMLKYYKKQYADIIYPAIYGKKYEEPVQLSIDDTLLNDLDSSKDILDTSNEYGRTRTQFKQGNTQGVRFAPKQDDSQEISILLQ